MKHNPLIPMGAITGRPTREELRKRLDDYRKIGIDQFMIYPRTGAELEYMSEEWLEACRHIIEHAEETGMAVWFYDEFNWPSGQCKGQVIKSNPEFCAKVLTVNKDDNGQFVWNIVDCDEMADVLNPDAMKEFIRLTHEKYYQSFGQYFKTVVKGIFTDEPSYQYSVGKVKESSGAMMALPYYEGLEEDYLKATGSPLRHDIEAMLNSDANENPGNSFYKLIGKRFSESFFIPVRKWCDDHGIFFTGHLMNEWKPDDSVCYSGAPLACTRRMSLPGIDEIFTHTDTEHIEWLTLNMVRDAAIHQGNGALVEVFALGPVDMPFGKLRQMLLLMGMHGVDHYVLAVSPLDARGNIEKCHYFTAFTPMQTYFDEMKLLADAAEETASLASKKLASGRIAVKYPESFAGQDAILLCGKNLNDRKKMTSGFNELLIGMTRRQWPVTIIGENEKQADAAAEISMTKDGWKLACKDGQVFSSNSLESLWGIMDEKIKRNVAVFESDGSIADNLLVEEYEDCIAVLNLTECERADLVCDGKKISLPSRGIKVIDKNTLSEAGKVMSGVSCVEDFEFSADRKNLMRCRFYQIQDTMTFKFWNEAGTSLCGIKLLLRNYPSSVKASLDGKEIECKNQCTDLTPGLNELYVESDELSIAPGEHVLTIFGDFRDVMFLPFAFFAGNFGLYPGFTLKDLPSKVSCGDIRRNGLINYAGKIRLKSELTVPVDAELMHLATGEQITEVKLDGVSLGVRAWAPFEWQIPDDLKGKKVCCEIIQTLSIGAIFGEYDSNSTIIHPVIHYLPGTFSSAGCLASPEWRKQSGLI